LEFLHAAIQEPFGVNQGLIHVYAGVDVFLMFSSGLFDTCHVFLIKVLGRLDQGQERVENVRIIVLVVLVILIHDF
jgi:hypothetical protein